MTHLFSLFIIELISGITKLAMDETDQKWKEALAKVAALRASKGTKESAKCALGIHFLQQIGKLEKEGTLDKVKAADEEINRKDDLKEIESEKSFYNSKVRNLKQCIRENHIKIEKSTLKIILMNRKKKQNLIS